MPTAPGSPEYAYRKLCDAVDALATGPGDVRARLLNAFSIFHPIEERDLPTQMQPDYRWVMAQLTRFGPKLDWKGELYRGSVEHTLERIQNSTGSKIAARLVKIRSQLARHLGGQA